MNQSLKLPKMKSNRCKCVVCLKLLLYNVLIPGLLFVIDFFIKKKKKKKGYVYMCVRFVCLCSASCHKVK